MQQQFKALLLFSIRTSTSPTITPSTLSPTPPQYPISSPLSSGPARRRVAPLVRTSYPLPSPPDPSERPRTTPSFRNRQQSSDRRHSRQTARAQDSREAEVRVNSAPVNSHATQRYVHVCEEWLSMYCKHD